ncbi:aldehyde dehydrogenase family protein, partial [bacterium]|nr:aldehyde dehydrogenase family protein [bacterium]
MILTNEPIQNFIGGAFVSAQSKKTLNNFEPATGQIYTTLPASDARDVESAVSAAEKAFPAWSKLSAGERAHYLRKMAEAIEQHLPELANAEAIDNGKPLSVAQSVDIPRSATNFRFFADAITQFSGESFQTQTDT